MIFPTAGNRFAIRIKKNGINSVSDLPSGDIAKTTNFDAAGGYNVYTRSAFEEDGSLIVIFAPTEETLSTPREVKIAWTKAGTTVQESDFTTYTFMLTNATLEDGLRQMQVGDTVEAFKFNTEMSTSEVKSILAGLSYENAEVEENQETIDLIIGTGSLQDNGQLKVTRVLIDEDTYGYFISVFPRNTQHTRSTIVYGSIANPEMEIEEGFQNLTDGKIEVRCTVVTINQGAAWNGIVAGK